MAKFVIYDQLHLTINVHVYMYIYSQVKLTASYNYLLGCTAALSTRTCTVCMDAKKHNGHPVHAMQIKFSKTCTNIHALHIQKLVKKLF